MTGGLEKGHLEDQVHALVVGEIPWDAVEEFFYLGHKIK